MTATVVRHKSSNLQHRQRLAKLPTAITDLLIYLVNLYFTRKCLERDTSSLDKKDHTEMEYAYKMLFV